MEAQNKDLNVNVIRSVWHRMKKGHIKVRDLQPTKDVKGGGGHKPNFPQGPPNVPQAPPT
jgi:hypothetical protein